MKLDRMMLALCMFIVLSIGASAIETKTYTIDSERVCNGNLCSLTMYGYPKFSNSNGDLLEDEESLLSCEFCNQIKLVVDEDKKFPLKVLDYNLHEIKVELSASEETTGKEIMLTTISKVATSIGKEQILADKTTSLELINIKDTKTTMTTTMPFGLDQRIKYGTNSTNVYLTYSGGEILHDASVAKNTPDTTNAAGVLLSASNSDEATSIIIYIMFKLNHTVFPNNSIILKGYLHLKQNVSETASMSLAVHHVNSTFNENSLTWNNQPCSGTFSNATQCNLTVADNLTVDMTNSVRTFNVTAAIKRAIKEQRENVSFALRAGTESATDVVSFNSKDSVLGSDLKPMLNITYYGLVCDNISSYETDIGIFGDLSSMATINFSLYDETTNLPIKNGHMWGIFNYVCNVHFCDYGTVKHLDVDLTQTSNFSLAIFPYGRNTTGNYTLYYVADEYSQRSLLKNPITFNNQTQIQKLYLLNTSKASTFYFRVVDGYSNSLANTLIDMQVEGNTVESVYTDSSGMASFLVNPLTTYIFVFTKSGYKTYTLSIKPVIGELYTVTLESQTTETTYSMGTGISYVFTPQNTVLNNGTKYNFTVNVTSSYWTITGCIFTLYNSTNQLNTTTGLSDSAICYLNLTYNTGKQTNIYGQVYYQLNGTYNETQKYTWNVIYSYTGDFSVKNLIDDISDFGGAGFNNFSRMMVAFIIIMAIMAYAAIEYTSFREPEALIILLWALVFLFSYIGWMDLHVGGKEFKYTIFFVITMIAGAYILRRHA